MPQTVIITDTDERLAAVESGLFYGTLANRGEATDATLREAYEGWTSWRSSLGPAFTEGVDRAERYGLTHLRWWEA